MPEQKVFVVLDGNGDLATVSRTEENADVVANLWLNGKVVEGKVSWEPEPKFKVGEIELHDAEVEKVVE